MIDAKNGGYRLSHLRVCIHSRLEGFEYIIYIHLPWVRFFVSHTAHTDIHTYMYIVNIEIGKTRNPSLAQETKKKREENNDE